jgi:hypothetical protein
VKVLGEVNDVSLGDDPSTVRMELGDDAREVAAALRSGDPAQARGLHLTIEGIEIDADPGIVYGMYLNDPEANKSTGHLTTHFVGLLTFFGAAHAGEHGPASRTFDIASLVHQLLAEDAWSDEQVTITFVPLGAEPPPGIAPEELDEGPLPDINLKSVTLTS